MTVHILVKDEKYKGKYVALKSFKDNTVVASAKSPDLALKKARQAGVQNPVLVFVPRKTVVHIY